MKADIQYEEFCKETVIYANTPRGAGWIARHITSNVADLHYTDKGHARERLGEAREDGLRVERLDF